MKRDNDKIGRDGGEEQESQCLFSVQFSEIERWNREMKEQSAYASPEQNPFITSIIFNYQQLYQQLQYSFPKSHMTCSQPAIDKPYGISLKGRLCFRWRNNWTGWADGVGWWRVKVRDNTTAPDWTTHLLFSQRNWQQSLSMSRYTISGLDTDLLWSEGIMGCHKYLPSGIMCSSKHWESAAMTVHMHACKCVCVSVVRPGLKKLFLLFQTVSEGAVWTMWVTVSPLSTGGHERW